MASGELVPRVGFTITNRAVRPSVSSPSTTSAEPAGRLPPTRFGSSSMHSPTISATSCVRCRAYQGVVADEPEGKADQDRRKGRQPRPLRRVPDGRGRHSTANVPGDFAADRGITAASATSARVKRSIVMHSRATDGRSASQCLEKWPEQRLDHHLRCPRAWQALHTSRQSCRKARKARIFRPVRNWRFREYTGLLALCLFYGLHG